MNTNPLVAENFLFRTKAGKPAKKSGKDIINVCDQVIRGFAADHPGTEARLIKTYRTREVFTPCLAFVINTTDIDDSSPLTLYIRPGLRNLSQGFKPDQSYERLFVASGMTADIARLSDNDVYDSTETSVMLVRAVRNELAQRLGGKLLKHRRPQCLLCGEWIRPAGDDSERPRCTKHGVNPPSWLVEDDQPMPPPAGVPALLVPA